MTILRDKVIVVTGAGRGIGAACAQAFAALGGHIVVNDRDHHCAMDVAASIRAVGGSAQADDTDISNWSAAAAMIDACVDQHGRIDGLLNNAGLFRVAPADEIEPEELAQTLLVNVTGTLACAVSAIRHMKRAGAGAIVNVTSGAQAGQANMAAYAASKGAVSSFTYSAAIDLAGSGVRINAVSPIGETRMRGTVDAFRATRNIPGRNEKTGPSPECNAPAIAYLLSDEAKDIHGQIIRINGNSLSVLAHPAIIARSVVRLERGIDGIGDAFATLRSSLQPLGLCEVETLPLAK